MIFTASCLIADLFLKEVEEKPVQKYFHTDVSNTNICSQTFPGKIDLNTIYASEPYKTDLIKTILILNTSSPLKWRWAFTSQ